MSGSAALSAARKRRASSSQMPGNSSIVTNTVTNTNTAPQSGGSYYGGGSSKQSLQGIMNQQPYPSAGQAPGFVFPKELLPNVPFNIYENIELIKKQIADRTKLIQSQASSIPADKLRILQKQNEVQTQILKQKMAIAQQMEISEQKTQKEQQDFDSQRKSYIQTNTNEPEFIYEKGIPRKNPKYKKPEEPVPIKPIQGPDNMRTSSSHDRRLSSFISMITETGVIPPPIVILKSHDEKLEEHHLFINDMLEQLDYLHSVVTNKNERLQSIKEETNDKKSVNGQPPAQAQSKEPEQEQAPEEEEEETELLMEVVMNDLTNSREFVEGIVDKIVNDTNLSEVIMKIEPIIKENQELRALIHSQQQMMNEINTMLFRLLNQQNSASSSNVVHEPPSPVIFQDEGLNGDGLYHTELTEIILTPSLQSSNDTQAEELEVQHVQYVEELEHYVQELTTDDQSNHEEHPDDVQPSQEVVQGHEEMYQDLELDLTQDQAQAQDQEQAQEQTPYHYEEPEYQSLIPNYDENYEMPHFPEPISLIVSEI